LIEDSEKSASSADSSGEELKIIFFVGVEFFLDFLDALVFGVDGLESWLFFEILDSFETVLSASLLSFSEFLAELCAEFCTEESFLVFRFLFFGSGGVG